jgi:hypothetical protein
MSSLLGALRSAPSAVGEITLYRLFDVGYEIDLGRASERLAGSGPQRARPARGEAQAIQIANPPVNVRLGLEPVEVDGAQQPAELSARLFDFGVVSLRATFSMEEPRPWGEWAATGARIGTQDWTPRFQRWRDLLCERLGEAIVKPDDSGVTEDYTVFQVRQLLDGGGGAYPVDTLTSEQIAALLFGERRPLSAAACAELLSQRFSYFEDDLAVLAWNAALIVEPAAEDTDVQYVLEFANAQLLELRYYDTVLDREVPRLHGEIAVARRGFHVIGRKYGRLLESLQRRVTDSTEVVERVENSLKLTEDVFLARVYTAALEIFRGPTWRRGIDRKVAILREAYSMLNDEAEGRRGEVLEITIILLIALELILALRR